MLPRLGAQWVPLIERAVAGLSLSAEAEDYAAIAAYLDHLAEWNARVDLTAARSPEEAVDLAVADAAILARFGEVGSSTASWVDVGAGAGAPGLVLALLRRRWPMTLVEPKDRRVAFLRSVVGSLGLRHVRVERGRSDRLPAAAFDVAVSRATLPPPEWLAEGARLARRAVWVLLARGEAPERRGFRVAHDLPYALPLTGAERRAVCFVPEAEPRD